MEFFGLSLYLNSFLYVCGIVDRIIEKLLVFCFFRVTRGILLLSWCCPTTYFLDEQLRLTFILQFPLQCLITEAFIYLLLFFITAADILRGEEGVWSTVVLVCFNLFHLMRHLRAAVMLTVKVIALQKQ